MYYINMVNYDDLDLQTLQQIQDQVSTAITNKQAVAAARPALDPSPPVTALRNYVDGLMDQIQGGATPDIQHLIAVKTLQCFYGPGILAWLKTFRVTS